MRLLLATRVYACLFVLLLASAAAPAQQPNKSKTPRLANDDFGGRSDSAVSSTESVLSGSGVLKRYSPKGLGLSIDLPGEPVWLELPPLPEEGRRIVERGEAYHYRTRRLMVLTARITMKRSVTLVSEVRSLVAGFLNAPSRRQEVSGLEMSLQNRPDSSVGFARTHKEFDTVLSTQGFAQARGTAVWLVSVTFEKDDDEMRELSRRIVESAAIDLQ